MSERGDNFWSWLGRRSVEGRVAMDAMPNGYKHPDGTPCKAKDKKNCPFFKGEIAEAGKIDDLTTKSEVSKIIVKASPSEMSTIEHGGNPNEDKFDKVSPDDLATMKLGSTRSKYREMRNALVEYVSREGLGDGTYPLVDVAGKEAMKDFKAKYYDDGYMVSFQTTNGEGYNRQRKDLFQKDEDYDALVEDLIAEGYKPHVGVFGGIPEISFKVDSLEVADLLMKKYNQVSKWDNARGAYAAEQDDNPELTKEDKDALWASANQLNPEYDWKTNQVVKAK